MRFYIVIIFLFLNLSSLLAQSNIALGTWKSYQPYQRANNMTQSVDKVYFNTGNALFSIQKDDLSPNFMSKVEGLNGSSIKFIEYDQFNKQLLVVYNDSKIDIIREDGAIIPVLNIAQNQTIPGDKSINAISIADEQYAYIATGFGIVQFDLQTLNFGYTCDMGSKVIDIVNNNSKIFVAKDDGIYHFNHSSNLNPGDFGLWSIFDHDNALPAIYESNILAIFDNVLYACIDNNIWKQKENDQFELFYEPNLSDDLIINLYAGKQELLIGVKENSNNSYLKYVQKDFSILDGDNSCTNRLTDFLQDEGGRIWFCDEWSQIRYINNKIAIDSDNCNKVNFNSPYSLETSDISIKDNIIYLANGGANEKYKPIGSRIGYSTYKDNDWEHFFGNNFPELNENDFRSLLRIMVHPRENKLLLGSFWNGFIIRNLDDGSIEAFNKDNSSLEGTKDDEERTRIGGMAIDDQDNIWLSNYGAQNPVSVYTKDGVWRNFYVGGAKLSTRIAIDDYGNKWIALFQGGVLVLKTDDNDIINGNYEYKLINSGNSVMKSNVVNDVIKDLDGTIWVGTSSGPVIFNCGDIFNNPCTGHLQNVLEDGDWAHLLENEDILCIEADGANRKWFGTKNGIFVQSADGENKVFNFDIKNSPLFDNTIKDLAFNPKEGEMLIHTNNGLQSYRTKSTLGGRTHNSEVYAFPNPVRPDYNGEIAIKGLPQNATVKITDMVGKMIYETTALGGQAVWNGKDYNGKKATTGVYLVFSSSRNNFENADSYVTKILFVN